jgi:uncharacterized protein
MSTDNEVLTPEERAAFLQSAENVQRASASHLCSHPDEGSVVTFVQNLHQAVDRVVGAAVQQGARIDCQAGCSHCCNARVEAIAPEIFLIAGELARRSASALAELLDRLQSHTSAPGQKALPWSHRPSCPFLENRLCSIYPVRPASCRKGHSADVGACEANAPTIPQHLEIVLGAEALQKGSAGAYRQRGFDGSAHELVSGVLLALTDPSAQARWYAGEPVFDRAAPDTSTVVDDVN